ncbi:Rid family detoxifying hydrolase [Marinomonas sp. C2222]|uniref:Rid family detoxifying hydrolase n=1 Tax=Marinomonas sargassi TaxID=2984494 RepID=A0ABT2YR62_9GAMM|nr:Rid family detoxifying hydrolase [Marinomonas sargassi]MCV2402386.1 Rid family detoxifying hydrolase [Marinomonas sargassi]
MKATLLKLLTISALTSILSTQALASSDIEFLSNEYYKSKGYPFSEAVKVGNTLYLSGQIGLDSKTGKLAPGGIEGESIQTMDNIKASLENHGYSMSDVVKCTVMLADIKEWGVFNNIYKKYFSGNYPARSAFAASGLALGARIEVECIAAVSN